MKSQLMIDRGGGQETVTVEEVTPASYRVTVGDEVLMLDLRRLGRDEYHLLHGLEGHDLLLERTEVAGTTVVHRDGVASKVTLIDERLAARAVVLAGPNAGARSPDETVAIRAPMPGKIVKALVRPGECVSAGQGVIVIEAMKMENELRAPIDGIVKEIRVLEGANVEAGEQLVFLE